MPLHLNEKSWKSSTDSGKVLDVHRILKTFRREERSAKPPLRAVFDHLLRLARRSAQGRLRLGGRPGD